jgi:hypothetical protein
MGEVHGDGHGQGFWIGADVDDGHDVLLVV